MTQNMTDKKTKKTCLLNKREKKRGKYFTVKWYCILKIRHLSYIIHIFFTPCIYLYISSTIYIYLIYFYCSSFQCHMILNYSNMHSSMYKMHIFLIWFFFHVWIIDFTKVKFKTIKKKLSWYIISLQVKKHLIFQKVKILIRIRFKKYLNHFYSVYGDYTQTEWKGVKNCARGNLLFMPL